MLVMLSLRNLKINIVRSFCKQATKKISSVGFIGLGNMGYRMCKNLVKKGFDVAVYDKNNEPLEKLEKQGARAAKDAKEVVSEVDCVITMLPDGPELLSFYSPQIIKSVKPKSLVIDTSTVEYTVAQELQKMFKLVDVSFIDAPVSGGILAAENASLTFMIGGDPSALTIAEPLLRAMGTTLHHCGSVGTGQIAKACNNLLLGITMAGLSEAMAISSALGLDPKLLTKVINSSSGQCWSSTVYNPFPGIIANAPSSNDYKAGFTTRMLLKDLGIANTMAKNAGIEMEVGKKTRSIYDSLCKNGLSDKDFSVIYSYITSKQK